MNIWLYEQPEKFPWEPYEKLLFIAGTGAVMKGNMTEEIAIIEVDAKMASKARRYNKKRMSIYEKVEGFSYSIKTYYTAEENPDPDQKRLYLEWKERMKGKELK